MLICDCQVCPVISCKKRSANTRGLTVKYSSSSSRSSRSSSEKMIYAGISNWKPPRSSPECIINMQHWLHVLLDSCKLHNSQFCCKRPHDFLKRCQVRLPLLDMHIVLRVRGVRARKPAAFLLHRNISLPDASSCYRVKVWSHLVTWS